MKDKNAQKALQDMKMEMANELLARVQNGGKIGGTMTKRLVEMGEKSLTERK